MVVEDLTDPGMTPSMLVPVIIRHEATEGILEEAALTNPRIVIHHPPSNTVIMAGMEVIHVHRRRAMLGIMVDIMALLVAGVPLLLIAAPTIRMVIHAMGSLIHHLRNRMVMVHQHQHQHPAMEAMASLAMEMVDMDIAMILIVAIRREGEGEDGVNLHLC